MAEIDGEGCRYHNKRHRFGGEWPECRGGSTELMQKCTDLPTS
jgi:hypothetical protein